MAIDPEAGQHRIEIMDRGGERRIAELTDVDQVVWHRERDEISTASVSLGAEATNAQADLIQQLIGAIGRYEMCIFRGDDRVWEGPITLGTFHRQGLDLEARDVMHYGARTIMRTGYDNSYPNCGYVTDRAELILLTELARKEALDPPINVLEYLVNHHVASTDARTCAKTLAYQYTVYEHIDSLAARNGMDYTVLGRAIHLWDTSVAALGYTPTMTEADFLGEMYISVYGMELGTIATVTDGQGNAGTTGAVDAYYGEVERLDTAYDEDQTAAPTTAELVSQAQRNLAGRNPTPVQVRVPDSSSLDMRGNFTINMLVPGTYVPLRATLNSVDVSQMQKIQNVTVTETEQGETVQITLYPASNADEPEEE